MGVFSPKTINNIEHGVYTKELVNTTVGYNYHFAQYTWTDLIPGSQYNLNVYYTKVYDITNPFYGPYGPGTGYVMPVYTDVAATSAPYFENIKDRSLTVKWNTTNRSGTTYDIQRSTSPSGPWTTLGTTSNNYFVDTGSGLVPEQNYYYRIVANHQYITQSVSSNVAMVTTTADPAVAAAQEAATKAEVARESAINAQTASQNAEAKANEAVELIKALDTKFNTQLTNIQGQMQPAILSVKTTNGATATKSGSINIVATAINASQYRYRVNNGAFSGWQLSPVINISSLSPGVNVIEVQATNSLEDGAPVSSGYITVFNLP